LSRDLASIIIVTYNSRKYLEDLFYSLKKQDYPHEIILVDNDSSDGTADAVERNYPHVRLIKNKNVGYGAGNNLGIKHAKGEYVVILNPDVVVEEKWLSELIKPIKKFDKMITTPKVLMWDGKTINTCGNTCHFTALSFTNHLDQPRYLFNKPEVINGISGACFALRKNDYEKIGGFDETFFLYAEDTDFSWRANIKGFQIRYVPTAIMKHDYRLEVSAAKIYHLEKGRYFVLRKYYPTFYFLMLLPSFLVAEILVLGYSVKTGSGGMINKMRALRDGFFSKVDKIGYNEVLLKRISFFIPPDQLSNNILEKSLKKFANLVFFLNYRVLYWGIKRKK